MTSRLLMTAGLMSGLSSIAIAAPQQPPTADLRVEEVKAGICSAALAQGTAPLVVTFSAKRSESPGGRIKVYRWTIDDEPTRSTGSPTFTKTFSTGGVYEVTLVVVDNWGNESAQSAAVKVEVKPSTLHATARHVPSESTTVDRVRFGVVGCPLDDALRGTFTWDFGDGSPPKETTRAEVDHDYTSFDGLKTVTVKTRWDTDIGHLALNLKTTVDVKGPVKAVLKGYVVGGVAVPNASSTLTFPLGTPIGFSANGSKSEYGDKLRFEFDLAGDNAFEVDAGAVYTTTRVFRTLDHPYAKVRVTDEHGNQGIQLIDFRLSGLLPLLDVSPLTVPVGSKVRADASRSRDMATMTAPVSIKVVTSLPLKPLEHAIWEITVDKAGPHTLECVVGDEKGNKASTTVVVIGGGEPRAILVPTPGGGACSTDKPLQVTLSGEQSNSGGGAIIKYEWDLDGDGVFETDSEAASALLTIETPGTHIARLRVTDALGQTDVDTVWITTQEAQAATGASLDLLHTCKGFELGLRGEHSFSNGKVREHAIRVANCQPLLNPPGWSTPSQYSVTWSGRAFTINSREESKGPTLKLWRVQGTISEDATRLERVTVKYIHKWRRFEGGYGGDEYTAELVNVPLQDVLPSRQGANQRMIVYALTGPTSKRHVKTFKHKTFNDGRAVDYRDTAWDERAGVFVSFLQTYVR